MKKVSVIVPVYNVENELKTCIESILNQSYETWELWLIDDGSTDKSPMLCDEYVKKDSRIHVLHKANGGVSAARNSGLQQVTGEYVLFVDSDDYLEKQALERLVTEAESKAADVVLCGFFYRVMHDNSVVKNVADTSFSGDNKELAMTCFAEVFGKDLINPPWNKLIKRSILQENNLQFNEAYSILEDLSFSIQLLEKCSNIVIVREALYNYVYKEQNNLVHKFHSNFFEALLFFDECMSKYSAKVAEPEIEKIRHHFFCRKTLMFLRKIYKVSGFSNKQKYSELRRICSNERLQTSVTHFETKDKKKRVAFFCMKHRLYLLLHLLYLVT